MNVEASQAIIRGLKAAGVDMLAILPDHGFDRVQKMAADDPSFLIAPVSNEGVGVGMCAGAYLGGKTPAIMIPTSGFLVAVWPLASLDIPVRNPIAVAYPLSRRHRRCSVGNEDLSIYYGADSQRPTDSVRHCQ